MSDKIGKIILTQFPFYDIRSKQNKMKKRPVFVLRAADSGDYNVLPISTISKRANVDPDYDIPVDPALYPQLSLKEFCYIRTHKQSVVSVHDFVHEICDVRVYESLYIHILECLERYNRSTLEHAFP